MEVLLGKTLAELQAVAQEVGLPRFAGKQLAEWIYVRRATSFDEMTNISLKGREALKERYTIGRHAPVAEAVSKDGTKKYLFQVGERRKAKGDEVRSERLEAGYIEAVYIPDDDRATLCVSTQAGCKMGCKFCMTGTLGFHGHLSAADILNQIFSIPDADKLTNIVYMGEGEPMDNLDNVLRSLHAMTSAWGCAWSPKRITVSSVGLLHLPNSKFNIQNSKLLQRFIEESDCHLAISLHNPFSTERQEIMPIEKVNHLSDVIALLKQYDWSHQRRISFEYICWGGVNDTPKHANELLRLLKGLDCRINLIRFHGSSPALPSREGVPPLKGEVRWGQSDEQQMEWLRDYLTEHGITTTIRRSRGEDILAACGMLVNALKNE
ncbi:MAG: 23S rRNA (adenine(2503)-C(2))-methyltransferase RlmN [Paludibacteraceae bacterium]|nr:23S rRNA (adenine(2503)-C(2))-methyltransferase RlmN [Paludibacteraceae bacterium]